MTQFYLEFPEISSPSGSMDLFVDLTGRLKPTEVLQTVNVVSADPSILDISNVAPNTLPQPNGAEIGKGVHLTAKTLLEANKAIAVNVAYVGDQTSADNVDIAQPIIPSIMI